MKILTQMANSHTHLEDELLEVYSGKSGNIFSGCGLEPTWAESTAETYGRDPTLSWSCPLSHTNRRKLGTPQGQQKNKQAGNHPHGCSSPCPRPLFRSRNIVSHLDYHSRLPPLPRHPHGPRAGLPTTRSRGKGHAPQHLQSLFKSVQFTARL